MTKPLFSILISNYNNASYLEECIKSCINQSYEYIEIVFVDDNSTDNSIDIAESLAKKDDRIKIFKNNKNEGAGFTKKRMIEESTGVFSGILDSDDILEKTAVEKLVEQHLKFPNASVIYTSTTYFDETGDVTKKYRKTFPQKKGVSVIDENNISHFVTFKNEFYRKSIGLNPLFQKAVDLDFYIIMEEVGDVIYLDEFLYNHRIHTKGISQSGTINTAHDWGFIIKMHHLVRRKQNPMYLYESEKNWWKYDVSVYSNLMLFKIFISRLLKFKK